MFVQQQELAHIARTVLLQGVGDASLGEWLARGDVAMHVRRRLAPDEQARIGEVRDIRGTLEAVQRHRRVFAYLPKAWQREIV